MSVQHLSALFRPTSVAVFGASRTPNTVGAVVMHNLLAAGFAGPVMPVNPKYESVAGVLAYPDVAALPVAPDLAVVCTPPTAVPGIIDQLGRRGTRAAAVLTAGLSRQTDDDGRRLDRALLEAAGRHGMRVLGPNCVGLLVPGARLNASFAHLGAAPGSIAFVSQSGALCTSVLDWASSAEIGFSCCVSLGDAVDVDFGDVIDWLGADPGTSAILLYIESIQHARKFLSAARTASRNKPIVAIKAGRVEAGERAAASHTGALAGSDDVADYALRRAGILRVGEIDELFAAVETLARRPHVHGERLAIVTNGGGVGVMATDALIRGGGALAELSPDTVRKLDAALPRGWSAGNPVDIIGDAQAERFRAAVEIVAGDPGTDALLVLQAPTAVVDRTAAAEAVVAAARSAPVPMLTSWLGGDQATRARQRFADAGIPTYETPGEAVNAFLQLTRYRRNRELLLQTPPSLELSRADVARARAAVASALEKGGGWLGPDAAFAVLDAFGIPAVRTELAAEPADAARVAAGIDGPVALKIRSRDLLHKSDVGGVVLDLESPQDVEQAARTMLERLRREHQDAELEGFVVQAMARRPGAHELLVGAAVDEVFGPFVMFGQGGTAVEVLADRAVALPPLNLLLARDMVERTRIARLLAGYRDRAAADSDAIHRVLVAVSDLLAELPEVVELDVNPLLADEHGVLAVDARIRVAQASQPGARRLAIRPYPRELEETATLRDGRSVLLRPIRPEDEPSHLELFRSFRDEDIRFRFFNLVREMPHSQLARYTQIDYDREMAFVAIADDGSELGVVRAVRQPDRHTAEFAIIIAPQIEGLGLGPALLEKMIRYAQDQGVRALVGRVLADNRRMLALARSLGFTMSHDAEAPGEVEVRLELGSGAP